MSLSVKILSENTAAEGLGCEHGLSVLLERDGRRLLFDCGSGGLALKNARKMGASLDHLSAVAISHNHYDHSGGFPAVWREYPDLGRLYLSRDFFKTSFYRDERQPGLLIPSSGPLTAARLCELGVPYALIESRCYELPEFPGAWLMSDFLRSCPFEPLCPDDLSLGPDGFACDGYSDEQALAVEVEGGIALFTGCAHAGIVNLCLTAEERLGRPLRAVIGGSHLMLSGPDRIEATADWLAARNIQLVGICHCTGPAGVEAMLERGFERIYAGWQRVIQ